MKKTLAALAMILPLAAAAQYEPVAPAAAESAPAYSSRRSPWYIGFGIGTGDGGWNVAGSSVSFKDWHGTSPTNLILNFKLGFTASPNLLIGFDTTGIISTSSSGGVSGTAQINNYDAMVTFFPQGEGVFVRGGVGLSRLGITIDTGLGTLEDSVSGFNVLVGAGYAFWVGQSFNLTANIDYSYQTYGSSSTEPESSNFWALWVGFDWY